MEIVEKRIRERNNIISKSGEYAKTLNFRCTVILIGSYARGDFNLWSDVDLLIIGNFDSNPLKRLKSIDFPAGYETILLTLDEVKKMAGKNNKFIKDAFSEGIILRNDFGIDSISINSR
jgi:predicted nucleotidyltransferase